MSSAEIPPEDRSSPEIVVSRVFTAPRELVWRAMTDPLQVAQWWGPRGFSTTIEQMDFRVGGVWQQTMHGPDGTNYPNRSVFLEIVEPERIVYSHGGGREGRPGTTFVAHWIFEVVEPGKTRLTMRMVFAGPDERHFVVKQFGALEGGKQTLMRLSEHLARGRSVPFVLTREFSAPRDLMWKTWTERDRLMQWFGPKGFTMPVATMDLRPGGTFHFSLQAPDGKTMWGKFVYREITPPEKLVWINSFSDPEGGLTRHPFSATWPLEMLTEATFTEHEGKTTVTITWLPIDATDEECQSYEAGRPSMAQGWGGTLEQLTTYLAKARPGA
jgi:uncharacterized protein YndB with AHSA1/START domain